MLKRNYINGNVRIAGLLAIMAVVISLALTSFVSASNSPQTAIPTDALVLERTFDPETGEEISVALVYQDAGGNYLYAEGNGSVITSERSATSEEIQRYQVHLTASETPEGEANIIAWVENRISQLDTCIAFFGNYQVMTQANQVAAQDNVGACLELMARTQKQEIKYIRDTLVIGGVIEP